VFGVLTILSGCAQTEIPLLWRYSFLFRIIL